MITFIKFFFTALCSFYLFKKILKIDGAAWRWFDVLISLALAVLMAYGSKYSQAGCLFILVAIFCVICGLHYKQAPKVALVAGIVALGMSYIASSISSIVLIPIVVFATWMPFSQTQIQTLGFTIAGLMQCFVVTLPFRFGRLVNGMPYLRDGRAGWFGAAISLHLLLATALLSAHPGKDVRVIVYIILAAESGIVLIAWWYSKLVSRYFEKIKDRQIEQLRTDVQQLESDKSAILIDNMELAKIIHTDSKVVPAIGTMLKEILDTAEFPDEAEKAKALDFAKYIDNAIKERTGKFFDYHNKSREFPQTNDPGIDAMIRHMASRAYEQGISFDFICPASIKHLPQETISSGDLSKMIGDLAENAIIAERDSAIKEIFLSIQVRDACYTLDIADSGIEFDPTVVEKLGIECITTHADTGGSGLGLLSIIEIVKKVNASFALDETLNKRPFSKRISICFDGLGQIRVKTKRPEILSLNEARQDITWL